MGIKRRPMRAAGPPVTVVSGPWWRALALPAALLAAACGGGEPVVGRTAMPPPPDPRTAAALLRFASVFNHDYGTGDYRPVYARSDARSQAIISEAGYLQRHAECPAPPGPAPATESAVPGPHGAWPVHYEIGGQQLTDYWFYVHRRWAFDLVPGNPDAVRLYRMSAQRYAAAVGRAHGSA